MSNRQRVLHAGKVVEVCEMEEFEESPGCLVSHRPVARFVCVDRDRFDEIPPAELPQDRRRVDPTNCVDFVRRHRLLVRHQGQDLHGGLRESDLAGVTVQAANERSELRSQSHLVSCTHSADLVGSALAMIPLVELRHDPDDFVRRILVEDFRKLGLRQRRSAKKEQCLCHRLNAGLRVEW